jgi:hypothetical protein
LRSNGFPVADSVRGVFWIVCICLHPLLLGACGAQRDGSESAEIPASAAQVTGDAAQGAATLGGGAATAGSAASGELREMFGLALRKGAAICVATRAHLAPGYQLTLVAPAAAGAPDEPARAYAALIVRSAKSECASTVPGTGIEEPGDSLYMVSTSPEPPVGAAPLIALNQTFERLVRRSDSVYVQLYNPDRLLSFRVCTSGEGLHLTAWVGPPITGRRVWHRYYYLGYDVDPNCVQQDYEGTGGLNPTP